MRKQTKPLHASESSVGVNTLEKKVSRVCGFDSVSCFDHFRKKAVRCLLFVFAGSVLFSSNSRADELSDLRDLVISMQEELKSLRAEVEELKQEKAESVVAKSSGIENTNVNPVQPIASSAATAIEPTEATEKYLDWYGYFKTDIFHDTATTLLQEVPHWILRGSEGNPETDFTARQSRFGFNVRNPSDVLGGALTGKLEMDFFGAAPRAGSLNNNHAYQLRTRHAYLKWSNDEWDLIAGKSSQLIDVLVPQTVNFGYYSFQGRLGNRRAQIQANRKISLGDGRRVSIATSLEEPMGGVHGGDLDLDGRDDGTKSEIPGLMGRIRYEFPGFGERKSLLTLAGMLGKEEVAGRNYDSYGVNFGAEVPLTDWLSLQGTLWTGANLDGVRGGVAQGINPNLEREIDATGGWFQMRIKPQNHYWFNLGYSIDNPDDDDLEFYQRTENETYLFNSYYKVADSLTLGFEYLRTSTGYKSDDTATNHRLQSTVIYNF